MKQRAIPPVIEFLKTAKPGTYFFDAQFGKINYVSDEVSAVISTRVDAGGDYFIIEVEDEQDNIRAIPQP